MRWQAFAFSLAAARRFRLSARVSRGRGAGAAAAKMTGSGCITSSLGGSLMLAIVTSSSSCRGGASAKSITEAGAAVVDGVGGGVGEGGGELGESAVKA